MFDRFSHVMFYVTDMERSLSWYKEKLGFRAIFEDGKYSVVADLRIGFMAALHYTETPGAPQKSASAWFEVLDVRAKVAELEKLGVDVDEAKKEGNSPWFANFRDPDGNPMGMQEPWAGSKAK